MMVYIIKFYFFKNGYVFRTSRPDGDISRWEKVLKRLSLLNKHYPMKGKIVIF